MIGAASTKCQGRKPVSLIFRDVRILLVGMGRELEVVRLIEEIARRAFPDEFLSAQTLSMGKPLVRIWSAVGGLYRPSLACIFC